MQTRVKLMVLVVLLSVGLAFPAATQAGGPVGGDRFLIYNAAGISEVEAAVVYNTQNREYLVVWEGNGIWGRRVASGGTPIGSAFQISSSGTTPSAAYNIADDEYLIVWADAPNVKGQILTGTGTKQGAAFTIALGSSGIYSFDQPVTAYASTEDRYLVVYRYNRQADSGSQIQANCYFTNGTQDTSFDITTYSNVDLPEKPALAYNRSRNEYLVVWQRIAGADIDVYGQRVKLAGGADVLESNFPIAFQLSIDEIEASVAAIPTVPQEGRYLVAWEQDGDIYARSIAGDMSQGSGWIPLADTPWGEYRPAVAGNEDNDQFLVTWTWIPVSTSTAMMQVQGRTLALDGTLLKDTTLIGGGQVFDSAVAAGSGGDFLVAFDDNETFGTSSRGIYGRLWGERVYLPLVLRP